MNEEIKEILDRIETASEIFDCLLKPEECTELLDYITNLQKTNKNHSKKLIELGDKITNLQEELSIMVRDDERSQETIIRLTKENKRLKEWKEDLLKENIELENIRKEAVEYIHKNYYEIVYKTKGTMENDLLNILQKGE